MTPIAATWLPVRWLAALSLVVGVAVAVAPAARHTHAHAARHGSFAPSPIHRCHQGHQGQRQMDRDEIRRELQEQDRLLSAH